MEPREERALTDSGLTGDKIKANDPAAAPSGTDAEAAGASMPGRTARDGVRHLMKTVWSIPAPDVFGAWRQPRDSSQRRLGWLLLAWGLVLAGLGIAAGLIGLP